MTDGTTAGTILLRDIYPGYGGSSPRYFAALGDGRPVFSARNLESGDELRITDGTAAGTLLLKDVWPGSRASYPRDLASLGQGLIAFSADDPLHGQEPCITDGTPDGTRQVRDVNTEPRASGLVFSPVAPGVTIFAQADALGREPWIATSGPGGVARLADLYTGSPSSNPAEFTALGNGRTLFAAANEESARELWVTDGTAAGTAMIFTFRSGYGGGSPGPFAALGDGRAMFAAEDDSGLQKLWISDGTTAGTAMVNATGPAAELASPRYLTSLGDGRVLFQAYQPGVGQELFISDGTAAGTALVADIRAGSSDSFPDKLTTIGSGRAIFIASDGIHGQEVWGTDGTAAGTSLLKDIRPPSYPGQYNGGSYAADLTRIGNGLALFTARNASFSFELWATDGTPAGTSVLTSESAAGPDYMRGIAQISEGLALFGGRRSDTGMELWVTDGTAGGTRLLADLRPGSASSYPRDFAPVAGGRAVFSAFDEVAGRELWVSDGTEAGTGLLRDIVPGPGSSSIAFLRSQGDGTAVFVTAGTAGGLSVWRTDGTAAGTQEIGPISLPTDSGEPIGFTALVVGESVPPTLLITSSDSLLSLGEAALITFAFSTAVQAFEAADVAVTGGSLGALSTADNQLFTATFTPTPGTQGPAGISVAAGSYSDLSGTPGGFASLALQVDQLPPAAPVLSGLAALADFNKTTGWKGAPNRARGSISSGTARRSVTPSPMLWAVGRPPGAPGGRCSAPGGCRRCRGQPGPAVPRLSVQPPCRRRADQRQQPGRQPDRRVGP